MLNLARDVGMVGGKQMNWGQSREGCEPLVFHGGGENRAETWQSSRHGSGSGNCRAGRKALHVRAPVICNEVWGCVDEVGDAPLCERK